MKPRILLCAFLFASPIFAVTTKPATTNSSDAQTLLDRIHASKMPTFDRKRQTDEKYVQGFQGEIQKWAAEKSAMEQEFLAKNPDHPEADKIREDRWRMMLGTGDAKKVEAEANAFLNELAHKDDATALYMLAGAATMSPDSKSAMPAIERLIAAHPKDPRGGELLFMIASNPGQPSDPAIIDRIIKDYPDTDAGRMAAGQKRLATAIGKPFELEFDDITTGRHISMKDLKGKVVVVDFWATWCGPCVSMMPEMKRLYAEYKKRGVEFVGVSLDEPKEDGGLDALKTFIKENEITWPQYYQGNSWGGKFSASWGISMVPTVFVVDREGNLLNTQASGGLELVLTQALSKKKQPAATTAP
jgi:thiol-disulfide isomerase/thioredoxin